MSTIRNAKSTFSPPKAPTNKPGVGQVMTTLGTSAVLVVTGNALAGAAMPSEFSDDVRAAHTRLLGESSVIVCRPPSQESASGPELEEVAKVGNIRVNYWSRPSPKGFPGGNLYAVGTRGEDGLAAVALHDLDAAPPGKSIMITGDAYDPSFNEKGLFVHLGSREDGSLAFIPHTLIQTSLKEGTDITRDTPGITFTKANAYHDVGKGLVIWPEEWQHDRGSVTSINMVDPVPNFTQDAGLHVAKLNGTTVGQDEVLPVPFHGDWQIDNEGKRVIARKNSPEKPREQAGYAVFELEQIKPGENVSYDYKSESFGLKQIAEIPELRGGKAQVFGDLVVTHHAATNADRAHYPAPETSDAQWEELLNQGTSDIYVYNLKTKVLQRVSDAGPGNFAKYPDFKQTGDGQLEVLFLQLNGRDGVSIMRTGTGTQPVSPPSPTDMPVYGDAVTVTG